MSRGTPGPCCDVHKHPGSVSVPYSADIQRSPSQARAVEFDLARLRAASEEVIDGRLDACLALLCLEERCKLALLLW